MFPLGRVYLRICFEWGRGVCIQLLGVERARARVILVLRENIWNAPAVSLIFPAFDDTGSLGFHPRQMVYPRGSTLGECLPFPCGE